MDFYTVNNLRKDIDSNLHAGGTSQLQDFYNTLEKGRRAMIKKIRPAELIRKAYLEEAMFPTVERYAVPGDLKYSDVIELGLLDSYRNVDTLNSPLTLVYRKDFGQNKPSAENIMNIGYENGVKYARVKRPSGLTDKGKGRFQVIHDCDSLNENGTWNMGGNVVNLQLDELNYVQGKASLAFDINNTASTGFIENFTMDSVDLNDFFDRGANFAWLDISVPKELTSVKITLGSDTSDLANNLYHATVNQPHDNNQFTSGWNLLKWMYKNLAIVGTPNPRDIKYIRFDFTTTGQAIPGCHLDSTTSRIGSVYEMTYNGRYVFMDATSNAWKKFATKNSDIVVAEEDTYDILMLEGTLAAQKELYVSGIAAKSDVAAVEDSLREAYYIYKKEHKSEALLVEADTRVFGNYLEGWTSPPLYNGVEQVSNVQTQDQQ